MRLNFHQKCLKMERFISLTYMMNTACLGTVTRVDQLFGLTIVRLAVEDHAWVTSLGQLGTAHNTKKGILTLRDDSGQPLLKEGDHVLEGSEFHVETKDVFGTKFHTVVATTLVSESR